MRTRSRGGAASARLLRTQVILAALHLLDDPEAGALVAHSGLPPDRAACRATFARSCRRRSYPAPTVLLHAATHHCAQDMGRAWRLPDALDFGIVGVNEVAVTSEAAPFGGAKQSGMGLEHSSRGLEEFQQLKTVCMRC